MAHSDVFPEAAEDVDRRFILPPNFNKQHFLIQRDEATRGLTLLCFQSLAKCHVSHKAVRT